MSSSFSSKGKSTFSKFEGKGGGRSISLASSKAKITSAAGSSSGTKRAGTTAKRGKAAKKVYTLTGQKFDPPEEREPLRIFYESLSKQIPSSEMAEFWLMEHGLLSPERARKAYDRKQKRQQQIRSGTPAKSTTTTVSKHKPAESSWKKPSASHNTDSIAKAKRKVEYSDDDDDNDFIVKLKRSNSRGG